MIPLILKLKKETHKNIAAAQDILVEEMNNSLVNPVLHGGTAIWRCYKGNRFSEDIDAYITKDLTKINLFFKNLEKKGFIIEKKKISENSIYSEIKFNRTSVRFEALFIKKNGTLREYENIDGNLITVYTLTQEELINEKVDTYLKRLKVRDLYDIFFLLRYVQDKEIIKNKIKKLITEFKKPVDEKELKVLILEGIVPSVQKMYDYIKYYKL